MTFSIEPAGKHDLELQADEAERGLLRTLDALAERRRDLRELLSRARSTLATGALAVSALFALGAAGLLRRPKTTGARRVPALAGAGVLFLVGASVGLLSLALRPRQSSSSAG